MGKTLIYTAAAITFMGIGALITGLSLYFAYPDMATSGSSGSDSSSDSSGGGGPDWVDDELRYARCNVAGDNISGILQFAQTSSNSSATVNGKVTGLSSGLHGFHIHEFGGTGNGCGDAGGHFNPQGQNHGGPDSSERHVGDLGNIMSVGNDDTVAMVEIEDEQISLSGEWSIIGRAVVIHAGEDDLGASGDAAGAAGARVACCTIYIDK